MHLCQWCQSFHHQFRINAVIYQAGNLSHADLLKLLNTRHTISNSPEQSAVIEVPLEGEFDDRVEFFFAKPLQISIKAFDLPSARLKAGNAQAYCLIKVGAAMR